jgi:hypothetical protein
MLIAFLFDGSRKGVAVQATEISMGFGRFRTGVAKGLVSGVRSHRRLVASAALLLVAVAAVGAMLPMGLHGRRLAAVVVPYPHEQAQVSFAVAGDVIPHDPVRAAAAAQGDGATGWGALFSDVNDVFEKADFGFVNMETPVAPAHSHGSKPFMFDAPLALPQALKANGIKIVSFANNHVMDQGWAGFTETREHLRLPAPATRRSKPGSLCLPRPTASRWAGWA